VVALATEIVYGLVPVGHDCKNGAPVKPVPGFKSDCQPASVVGRVIPGFSALIAAAAMPTVFASDWQAATALCLVTPPRAKTTIAARIPRTTITIKSSIKVKPPSISLAALCLPILWYVEIILLLPSSAVGTPTLRTSLLLGRQLLFV